eukprot:898590_1
MSLSMSQVHSDQLRDYPKCTDTPLHRLSPQNLCYHIKEWVVNDIHYKSQLLKTKNIFSNHALSGKQMHELSTAQRDGAKGTIYEQLSSLMTKATLNIVCQCYDEWHRVDHDAVQSKSAEEIAEILYHYPLEQLLSRIEKDNINGAHFIQSLHKNRDIIAEETGWDEDESYQIQSVLFRHHTLTKSEFEGHMNRILKVATLPTETKQHLKQTILEYDVELVHYKIKNALPMETFSNAMIYMVDELMKDNEEEKEPILNEKSTDGFVKRIYEAIAECFIFDPKSCEAGNGDQHSHHLCSKLQHWVCNNCGNCSVNTMINSEHMQKDICILCGITQREQIIRKIKNYATYRLIHQVKKKPRTTATPVIAIKDTDSDPLTASISDTIQQASEDQSFDLSCPDQNNNDKCGYILRLTEVLIKYKRWLYTIDPTPTKHKVDIEKTIKVNIPKYIDNHCFQTICNESVESTAQITVEQAKSLVNWMNLNDNDMNKPHTLDTETFLGMDKRTFSETLHEHANTSIYFGSRIHCLVSHDLKQTAERQAIDIAQVDYGAFRAIFTKHVQVIQNQEALLTKMFEENAHNIADLHSFLAMPRKRFFEVIRKEAKVGTGRGVRLHNHIKQVLTETAQAAEFGHFLYDLDFDQVITDYYHIKRIHIDHGSKLNIENVFTFFERVIHWDDNSAEITDCRSAKRKLKRLEHLSTESNVAKVHHAHSMPLAASVPNHELDVWYLKQYYIQSELDVIHTYLVHSDWQRVVQKLKPKDAQPHHEHKVDPGAQNETIELQNKAKYRTDVGDSSNYGFGIDHSHPYLNPRYDSIHEEVLRSCLDHATFARILVKAIELRANTSRKYIEELACKYYDEQYNIIRNESIGLRHIFAILVYTDVSSFCTIFRRTYRKIETNESEKDITNRHQQMYYYARSLFEAVQFYGTCMESNLTVYHGLNHQLKVAKFTAYFNQPISSTSNWSVAQQFSQGAGIILALTAATDGFEEDDADDDYRRKTKYLSVSCFSCFPNEDEKLFYGEFVEFQICDIYTMENTELKSHSTELKLLNKWQKTVENGNIKWTNEEIQSLVSLINERRNNADDSHALRAIGMQETKTFARLLFNHFCDDQTKICIKNFKLLPK